MELWIAFLLATVSYAAVPGPGTAYVATQAVTRELRAAMWGALGLHVGGYAVVRAPGGQMFLTAALYDRLETEGQVAGVMAHEIGHVVARHSAERIAKAELTQGLTGAVVIASYDPDNPRSQQTAQAAAMIGQLVNMKFGRDDELESDRLAVRFMADAGYDPRSLIGVMEVLAEAGGPNRTPEFFSTHPNPENRIAEIREAIAAEFPNGVPEGLTR